MIKLPNVAIAAAVAVVVVAVALAGQNRTGQDRTSEGQVRKPDGILCNLVPLLA